MQWHKNMGIMILNTVIIQHHLPNTNVRKVHSKAFMLSQSSTPDLSFIYTSSPTEPTTNRYGFSLIDSSCFSWAKANCNGIAIERIKLKVMKLIVDRTIYRIFVLVTIIL
jgi:hypothetical protein